MKEAALLIYSTRPHVASMLDGGHATATAVSGQTGGHDRGSTILIRRLTFHGVAHVWLPRTEYLSACPGRVIETLGGQGIVPPLLRF